MNTEAVILIFLGIVSLSCAYTCSQPINCVKGGEVCTGNATYGCRGDSYCSTSSLGSGICLIPARLGKFCDSSNSLNCEAGTTCDTSISICVATVPNSRYLYPGESCSADSQCHFSSPFSGDDDTLLCRSGHCRHINEGDYCSSPGSTNQCDYNKAYCSRENICQKYIKKGGACNYQDVSKYGCGKGGERTCMPNAATGYAGTCKDTYSQKEGQFCRTANGVADCVEGLICYKAPLSSDTYGVCRKPANTPTLNQPCNSSTQCTTVNSEVCTCNGNSLNTQVCVSNVVPKGWRDAQLDLYNCQRKKGCKSINDYNCIKDKCHSQRCNYYKKSKQYNPQTGLSCTLEGLCNSGFTLVASPILAIAMLAIAFVL